MPKKFIPSPEQLEQILTRYEETKNYALVSRETGLSAIIIKRIIQESEEGEVETTVGKNSNIPKPIGPNEFSYIGPAPQETFLPTKKDYYTIIYRLMKEKLNVPDRNEE